MEKLNFSMAFLTENFKKIFANKRLFVFECVRLGLLFLYFIWFFIPFFTLKTSAGDVVAHFSILDHSFLLGLSAALGWFLFFALFAAAPLIGFNQNRHYLLYIIGAVELLYWCLTLLTYWSNLAQLNDLGATGFVLPLNIGFWFILLHIILVTGLALKSEWLQKIIDKFIPASKVVEAPQTQESKVEEVVEPSVEQPKASVEGASKPQNEVTETSSEDAPLEIPVENTPQE